MTKAGEPMQFFRKVVLVYEGRECLIWPFARDGNGYGMLYDGERMRLVHRLVCEMSNGQSPSRRHHAAHTCGQGRAGCVTRQHIAWKTPKANNADKRKHGTDNRGSRHNMAKLSEEQVLQIRSILPATPASQIALRFGVSVSAIRAIQRRQNWAWL